MTAIPDYVSTYDQMHTVFHKKKEVLVEFYGCNRTQIVELQFNWRGIKGLLFEEGENLGWRRGSSLLSCGKREDQAL